jgi:hypothetical protein
VVPVPAFHHRKILPIKIFRVTTNSEEHSEKIRRVIPERIRHYPAIVIIKQNIRSCWIFVEMRLNVNDENPGYDLEIEKNDPDARLYSALLKKFQLKNKPAKNKAV